MSRYRGPKLRMTRRLGPLPGLTKKVSIKRSSKPGQHGNIDTGQKMTEYGIRLEEKQKLKFNYGVTENQLYSYIKEARRRTGVTGIVLLQLLEMRLDNVCFTLGFASSVAQARQIVTHRHITVNTEMVNIPSFQCKIRDFLGVAQKNIARKLIQKNLKNHNKIDLPNHLKLDHKKLEAEIIDYCDRNDILLQIKELLVIEYYSRR